MLIQFPEEMTAGNDGGSSSSLSFYVLSNQKLPLSVTAANNKQLTTDPYRTACVSHEEPKRGGGGNTNKLSMSYQLLKPSKTIHYFWINLTKKYILTPPIVIPSIRAI